MDVGHAETEERLYTLEQKLQDVYSQAYSELHEKQQAAFQEYTKVQSGLFSEYKAGNITEKEYKAQLAESLARTKWTTNMVESMAVELNNADKAAASYINSTLYETYASNFNYGTYTVESGAGVSTNFTLYDRDTVVNLVANEPTLLKQVETNGVKADRWHRQKVTSAVTQGILQGESIDGIAKRLQSTVGMSASAAIRNARTATTCAENSGRINSYERAQALGISLKKEWLATLDGRTRHSHRQVDGEQADVDETFSNGLKYPGDPDGAGEEIYNCRCTLVAAVDGVDTSDATRFSRLPAGMDYSEWKTPKDIEQIQTKVKASTNAADEFNYFRDTAAVYSSVENPPDRAPDYGSRSGSEYWYTSEGVYRRSNHWGRGVASCDWYLDENNGKSSWEWENGTQVGFCKWDEFVLKKDTATIFDGSSREGEEVKITFEQMNTRRVYYEGQLYYLKRDEYWLELHSEPEYLKKLENNTEFNAYDEVVIKDGEWSAGRRGKVVRVEDEALLVSFDGEQMFMNAIAFDKVKK